MIYVLQDNIIYTFKSLEELQFFEIYNTFNIHFSGSGAILFKIL